MDRKFAAIPGTETNPGLDLVAQAIISIYLQFVCPSYFMIRSEETAAFLNIY